MNPLPKTGVLFLVATRDEEGSNYIHGKTSVDLCTGFELQNGAEGKHLNTLSLPCLFPRQIKAAKPSDCTLRILPSGEDAAANAVDLWGSTQSTEKGQH